MKSRLPTLFGLAILLSLNALVSCQADSSRFDLRLGQARFRVEVAMTPEESALGLMYRRQLEPDAGMIFVFEEQRHLRFWMKNTYIPLSIAFIDQRGQIVDIQDMQPLDETVIESARPARYAVEVNQGALEKAGVRVGDWMNLDEFLDYLRRTARESSGAR